MSWRPVATTELRAWESGMRRDVHDVSIPVRHIVRTESRWVGEWWAEAWSGQGERRVTEGERARARR